MVSLRSYVISDVSIGFYLAGSCFEKLCVAVNTLQPLKPSSSRKVGVAVLASQPGLCNVN